MTKSNYVTYSLKDEIWSWDEKRGGKAAVDVISLHWLHGDNAVIVKIEDYH